MKASKRYNNGKISIFFLLSLIDQVKSGSYITQKEKNFQEVENVVLQRLISTFHLNLV